MPCYTAGMSAERARVAPGRTERGDGRAALARDVSVLGLVWGASVVSQRFAVAEVEPLPLVALRLLTALAFFLPFLPRIRRGLAGSPRRLLDIGLVGALNPALCGILSAFALQFASSGLVAVLISLGPLLTVLLAKLLLDEPPLGPTRLAGLALAFGGVALLIATRSTGLEAGAGAPSVADGDLRGHGLALTIAVAMAVAGVYNRRRLGGTDPLAVAAGQIAAGLLLVGPLALLLGEPPPPTEIGGLTWLAIVASGTIGLGASFVLFQGMIGRHGPTAAMLALYTMPVVAAGLGALFLDETISGLMAGGAAPVLAGVVLFTSRR
jgi:drug/metabolite transporter (DMT)-like permease